MSETRQLCTFYLNEMLFGLEVERIQEIVHQQDRVHVPLAPATIAGLINLRGQIVTVIDLRRCLEMPDRRSDMTPVNVVIHLDTGVLSLLVDEVGDVLEVSEANFEPPPETLRGAARDLIRGAYKLEGRLLFLLDIERVIDSNMEKKA